MTFKNDKQRKAAMANMRGSPRKAQAKPAAKPKFTLKQLRNHHSRKSLQEQELDNEQYHKETFTHKDSLAVQIWLRNGGDADIVGVDDPDAEFRAATLRPDASVRPMDDELVFIPIKGQGRKRPMTQEQTDARQAAVTSLNTAVKGLTERLQGDEVPQRARMEKRLANLKRIQKAYAKGEYLVVAKASDKKLAEQHAAVLRERFDANPRSMESAMVLVGTTKEPGVYGYTHAIEPAGNVPADFIALNPKAFSKGAKEDPRDTLTHEQIHVMRKREAGRTKPETRGVKDYGQDRDIEEKYTVLEEQLRSAPPGTKRGVSYYGALGTGDDVPLRVGAADNRIARGGAKKAAKVRDLKVIEDAMHKHGHETYIANLHRDRKSGQWGRIPTEQEGIDRVFTTQDGDTVHVYNPVGSTRDLAPFVDRIDGKPGDTVYEYQDGRKVKVRGKSRYKKNRAEREATIRKAKRQAREAAPKKGNVVPKKVTRRPSRK